MSKEDYFKMFITNPGKQHFECISTCLTVSHDLQQKIQALSTEYRTSLNGDS